MHDYLSSLQPLAMRLGLERMERGLAALGHPERRLRALHVAGTNGKGSTCAMAAEALRRAGYRTGLYTSPHLVRFNERVALDGEPITDAALARRVEEVRRACPWHDAGEGERLTYFEFATLVALLHFAEEGAGAVVLEVGLGGRLDATNVVLPLACAVSRVGLDHTELLGVTLAAIAREKGGIFKRGVPAVVAHDQPAEALLALRAEAAARGAPLEVAPPSHPGPVALAGLHQQANAALAAAALRLLDRAGLPVGEDAIRAGLAGARWPGRLETVGGVLLDGAHNPDGAAALARRQARPGRPGGQGSRAHAARARAGGAGAPPRRAALPARAAHQQLSATRPGPGRPGGRARDRRVRPGLRPRGGRSGWRGRAGGLALPGGRGARAPRSAVAPPPSAAWPKQG